MVTFLIGVGVLVLGSAVVFAVVALRAKAVPDAATSKLARRIDGPLDCDCPRDGRPQYSCMTCWDTRCAEHRDQHNSTLCRIAEDYRITGVIAHVPPRRIPDDTAVRRAGDRGLTAAQRRAELAALAHLDFDPTHAQES